MFKCFLKLFYRITAPDNPRGWIDVNVTDLDAKPGTVIVYTDGMERFGLADLEIVDIPFDLRGYAHGMLFEIIWYMKNEKPILADENMGGSFGFDDPVVYQFLTARKGTNGRLRLVDEKEPAGSGFPKKLFASYLNCEANIASRDKAMEMLRQSLDIHPGGGDNVNGDPSENPNNYSAYWLVGDFLCDSGQIEDGLVHLRMATDRCHEFSKSMAEQVRAEIAAGNLPPADADPRSKFWSSR